MTKLIKALSCFWGFACAVSIPITANVAEKDGVAITAARASAIRECATSAARFPDYVWGNFFEMFVYRACMASHAQRE